MVCKHCGAEMEDALVCPVCGADNTEPVEETPVEADASEVEQACDCPESEAVEGELANAAPAEEVNEAEDSPEAEVLHGVPEKKKIIMTPGRIAVIVVLCVLLLGAIGAGVWYGVNGGWTPRENNVQYKETYTAQEAVLARKGDKVVATIGEHKLTNDQFQIFYWMQVYNFLDYYGGYASYLGLDYTKPLDTQAIPTDENMTWQQYFIEQSLKTWQRYQVLGAMAEEAGFRMSDALRQQLDSMPAQLETMAANNNRENAQVMLQEEMGPGATIQAYLDYLDLYYLGTEYFDTLYQAQKPTEAQVEAYFETNATRLAEDYGITKESKTVAVRHILLVPENGTTDETGMPVYAEEDWEACRVQAQEILDNWLAGGAAEEKFAELANTYSADPGSNTTGGLYAAIEKGTTYVPFDEWCFDSSRKSGDSGLVKSDMGYHIMYFVSDSYTWYPYCENALWNDLAAASMEANIARYPMEVNYKNIFLGNVDLGSSN